MAGRMGAESMGEMLQFPAAPSQDGVVSPMHLVDPSQASLTLARLDFQVNTVIPARRAGR